MGKRIPLDYDQQEDCLFFLSHELAHVCHFDHGVDHLLMTTKLFYRFGKVLHKIGFELDRNKR